MLYLWAHLTNSGIVREWVAEFTERPENVVRLLERFPQHSVTSVSGQPYARVTWFIPLTQLEAFADIGKLRNQVEQVSPETLNPEGKRALEAFAEAIRRRERGEPAEPVL